MKLMTINNFYFGILIGILACFTKIFKVSSRQPYLSQGAL
ncbi:hypothetical protein MuYL_2911 [Mucilaginibacter xinganensis]|uniref:Uncharacterized protein n=1 Tax=Mucilaginibacter xinganensis TaxID=1234841 RepID=A0A223NYZ3_9SPHI|nr:hypothetical protein MuYL_2911 [Mucilaginibacter xinganensis]